MKKFEVLEHKADGKIKAYGKNLEEAFANCALGIFSLMTDIKRVKGKIKKEINVEGKDKYSLLYNFLEELLFLFDAEGFLISEVKSIKINKNKLNAEISGDKTENYEFHGNVKAITYNEMEISEKPIYVQVVVDM